MQTALLYMRRKCTCSEWCSSKFVIWLSSLASKVPLTKNRTEEIKIIDLRGMTLSFDGGIYVDGCTELKDFKIMFF